MADGVAEDISQTLGGDTKAEEVAATGSLQQEDMDLETQSPPPSDDGNAKADLMDLQNPSLKRTREEEGEANGTDTVSKKLKPDKSVEEKRLEELKDEGGNIGEEEKDEAEQGKEPFDAVILGPKTFKSSVDMFDYFFKLLHYWQPNIDINEVILLGFFTFYTFRLCFD